MREFDGNTVGVLGNHAENRTKIISLHGVSKTERQRGALAILNIVGNIVGN